ncbi:MAG: patatin-like phospholipase family protein [Candidatus Cyclobacteriaceae bacterium M2_1C_046]
MSRYRNIAKQIYYSFPVQLLINHFRRNHIMLLCWILLLLFITGNVGNYMGIPYLFLDPEYLNEVGFKSFFVVGLVLAGFSIAFHIATYIMDGPRFSFIGTLSKPFTKFSLNNSIIPLAFLFFYILLIIKYQVANEYTTKQDLLVEISGLLLGYFLMTFILYLYFWFTNKDIFRYVVCKVDEKLKQNFKVTRASAMKKLDIARKKQITVLNFLDTDLKVKPTYDYSGFYDRSTILQVFDQNHFNLVMMQVFLFIVILTMGIFKDYEVFQLPAAASVILFLTVFVMAAGAVTYWFGRWATTAALIILLVLNTMVGKNIFTKEYKAFGMDYDVAPVAYTIETIKQINSPVNQQQDIEYTTQILNNWRNKFPQDIPPKMVLICVSGGGQRSALWTLNTLQKTDSATGGKLMKNAVLMTGASGGLIGAAYYRELYLQKNHGAGIDLNNQEYLKKISTDNLNPIIFSLLANDFFVGFQKFEYQGEEYLKDRGYSFEEQLNKNTDYVLDKSLYGYKEAEYMSEIPMMIMAPTIVNDGRKLYIGSHSVSYMSSAMYDYELHRQSGIDFMRFFNNQDSENLRFLSALRMSATFPYITPNTMLPSEPAMKIMDAGISDNFGVSDAIHFTYVFKDWIEQNTSGVILVSIRDSMKESPIRTEKSLNLFERLFSPISSIYLNFQNMQTITNDLKIEYAKEWLDKPLDIIDIQYIPGESQKENLSKTDSLRMENPRRASLSWRLTTREKQSLIQNIYADFNQEAIHKLDNLFNFTFPSSPLYVRNQEAESNEGVN